MWGLWEWGSVWGHADTKFSAKDWERTLGTSLASRVRTLPNPWGWSREDRGLGRRPFDPADTWRLSTAPGVAEQGPWLLALAPGAALAHSIQEGQQGGRWELAPRLPAWKLQALDLPLRSTLPLEQGQDQHWCWGRGRWQGETRMGISSSLPPALWSQHLRV